MSFAISTIVESPSLTLTEFEALPEVEGVERWLIRGQLREEFVGFHDRTHGRLLARFAYILMSWHHKNPHVRGEVVCGGAGFRLASNPATVVGADVAFVGGEIAGKISDETSLFDGPPLLAVEILSANDRSGMLYEKIDEYLHHGTKLVWLVNSHFATITVYSAGAEPVLFNRQQTITAEPHLPGFAVPVVKIFG